jgi:signal transduction histidine kinase/ActR/RegA family two-component response regulator
MGTLRFLSGGGVCGEVARSVDWSRTPLGPPESWSEALKTTVGIILHSRHPMFLFWGPELIQIYNDAYMPSFGVGKHPAAMGQRGKDCWQEIWTIIGPQIDDVMEHGIPSWNQDALVPIFRNGRMEEVYWSYSHSPVYEGDAIAATIVVCTETTARVLSERRLAVLRALAVAFVAADEVNDVARLAAEVLGRAGNDVLFFLTFGEKTARSSVGLDEAAATAVADALAAWSGRAARVSLPFGIPSKLWPEPITDAYVLPIAGSPGVAFAFGLNPRLPFDESYRAFLHQILEQVLVARARARAANERRNLLEQAPVATALLMGPDHVFESANPLYRAMVGRDVLGLAYVDAFPELRETPLFGILDDVYRSGEPFVTEEMLIPLVTTEGGTPEERFFKFTLQPIRDVDGNVYGMMAVAIDITEQVRARRALEQTNAERARLLADAEAASRAKDEFLAMLGHELRNPLAPILTSLDLMKLKEPVRLARERDIIERQAVHLVHLVDDLLDVSRVVQGKIVLKKARVPLHDAVARAVETASPLFEQKAQKLTVDVPNEGLDVDADPLRLSQVFANLLTNAAKYSGSGAHIIVRAQAAGDTAVVEVIDSGMGIAAEQLPRLFEAFFQGPRSTDRAEGGLGLGLSLVKSLIELHGGSVHARSEGVGRGSTFEVRLTRATSVLKPSSAPPRPSAARIAAARAAVRILLVDDNTDAAELFAEYLSSVGYDVRTAHDGPSALEVAAAFHPTIAVLDIGLPVMDGYELATRLRERFGADAPRLIAMTGYGQQEDRENSRRAGFEQHLVKPVDAHALLAAIRGSSTSV